MPIRRFGRHIKKLRRLIGNPGVDLWAVDEAHFQLYGSSCRMWIPPEDVDPVVWHHPTRLSVGYFGAVRLRDGKLVYMREQETFNKDTFWSFLKKLRRRSFQSGRQVVAILDNASYHHARLHRDWREARAPGFRLDFLPAYSPDFNPIERLWKLTRHLCTHNRYFPSLETLTETVEQTFDNWTRGSNTIRRLSAVT